MAPQCWTPNKIEEYANGFQAYVHWAEGHMAVLQNLDDRRNARGNYFIAYAEHEDRGYGDFPWSFAEEDSEGNQKLYSNLGPAIAQALLLSLEIK